MKQLANKTFNLLAAVGAGITCYHLIPHILEQDFHWAMKLCGSGMLILTMLQWIKDFFEDEQEEV